MPETGTTDPFEERLRHLVHSHTQPAAVPVDAAQVARRAIGASAGRRTHGGAAWLPRLDRRVLPLLAAAGILLLLGALALAGRPKPLPDDDPARLLLVRGGDLWVSAVDGSGATRIRTGGADGQRLGFLTALWSPDMQRLAAVRDTGGPVLTPAVDVVLVNGTLEKTIELGPGGTPSISWSPDGQHLAIATYRVDVRRNPASPDDVTPGEVHLEVVDLHGTVREILLPDGAHSIASAQPWAWTIPDLGVRWSPDGRWIAVAWDDPTKGRWHLVAPDGSEVHDLKDVVHGGCGLFPNQIDWFADGRRLAVEGGEADGTDRLCVEALGAATGPDSGQVAVIPEDPASNLHGKFGWPAVSPDGGGIASGDFMSDLESGRHVTTLRVYDASSGRATNLATGTQRLVIGSTGAAEWGAVLDGTPVWQGGVRWTPGGSQLLFLSPGGDGLTGPWTLRRVSSAAAGPSSVVASDVRSYDLGPVR